MKKNYGFLGYKYTLGRFGLWAVSNFNVFFWILIVLMVLGVVAGMYVVFAGMSHLLVFIPFIPMGLWGGLAVWGTEYRVLLPEYWIAERRGCLKKYPELFQILHEGDSITDEEIEQMKNLHNNYIRLKELFESKLEEENQLAERVKKLREEIEETSAKLRKEEKALGSHHG
jgi:hypothetical protein